MVLAFECDGLCLLARGEGDLVSLCVCVVCVCGWLAGWVVCVVCASAARGVVFCLGGNSEPRCFEIDLVSLAGPFHQPPLAMFRANSF
jgi:hypothetical protein